MHLVVFDDDAAVGRLVSRVATLAGYEATSVTDVETFRRVIRENHPHAIVLDLQLTQTDGIEQLRLLAEEKYDGTLILVSGFDSRVLSTAEALGRGLGLQIAAALTKPLQIDQLEAELAKLRLSEMPLSPARLLRAVREEELSLDFQPIVTRHPRALKKLEALIRWDHPKLGRISPRQFIGEADADPRVLEAINDWLIDTAIDAYHLLQAFGTTIPIAVNLSAQALLDLAFPDRLEAKLGSAGIPPHHFCLELTESGAFQNYGKSMDILSRLRLKGVALSLDDFGTGHSSLRTLRQLPFGEIKIDGAFVGDITASEESRTIVKSMIDLATNLGIATVGEGIEAEETAIMLESMGIGALQGFLIARPMPIENVPPWLARWTNADSEPHAVPVAVPAADVPATLAELPGRLAAAGGPETTPKLSHRQTEVIQLLTEGCSVKEIARRLDLGIGTVKVHLSAAYMALGAHNRIEAVMRAGMTPRGTVPASHAAVAQSEAAG